MSGNMLAPNGMKAAGCSPKPTGKPLDRAEIRTSGRSCLRKLESAKRGYTTPVIRRYYLATARCP
jgi:hypothetical protein